MSPKCQMLDAQLRLRYAEEANCCSPDGGSQHPCRALGLKAHTTSGLSRSTMPCPEDATNPGIAHSIPRVPPYEVRFFFFLS
jgi:hypothetical protein